jgi:hypothetical protein
VSRGCSEIDEDIAGDDFDGCFDRYELAREWSGHRNPDDSCHDSTGGI